jgi:hypothetical protein
MDRASYRGTPEMPYLCRWKLALVARAGLPTNGADQTRTSDAENKLTGLLLDGITDNANPTRRPPNCPARV